MSRPAITRPSGMRGRASEAMSKSAAKGTAATAAAMRASWCVPWCRRQSAGGARPARSAFDAVQQAAAQPRDAGAGRKVIFNAPRSAGETPTATSASPARVSARPPAEPPNIPTRSSTSSGQTARQGQRINGARHLGGAALPAFGPASAMSWLLSARCCGTATMYPAFTSRRARSTCNSRARRPSRAI